MASVTTGTSEWIQFFKDAGIPASLAVTYAVSFVDHRIQKNMLMDLSKDIMMDLGITVIGDIIAILKHAKQVYRQDMCKMATEAISSGQTSVQAELRKTANTPATRMIANALSHESPPATPARRPDNRLCVTVSNTQANKNNKAVVSQPADEGNGLPAGKRRRVTAEMEGLKRTSVFERLGAESKADTTNSNSKPTGVFSRLDGGETVVALNPGAVAENIGDADDSDGEGSVLQYAGVLKKLSPSQKKKPFKKAAPTTLRRLGAKFKLSSSDAPTSSSTSSTLNGLPPAKISVLQRLGKVPVTSAAAAPTPADTQDNRVTSTKPRVQDRSALANSKVSSSTGAGGTGGDAGGAQMDIKAVSVFKRLGSKRT
ncbi:uncharacterized protein C19orf47 homolog isoform X4 [Oryzias latipes]|uniref:uncharacterized protein C19orf47 homolog isoform X4 n=1 Tax=Oryzias latipes TaxID=8090 RepID=UPI0009D92DFF|nr:uncharacterized protein C19orf47 homolog isoform X4 [Oryzias latipes]